MESGGMAQGGSCGVRTQGKTRVREREKPMVRWCRGMAHHCQAQHGHGIATSGVHMKIILEISVALPCVKSPVSRTSGTILSGDVSGKRFSAHIVEGNVAGNGKRVAAGRRCGACHIPTRHNIDMALRHWGAHGDNFGDQ